MAWPSSRLFLSEFCSQERFCWARGCGYPSSFSPCLNILRRQKASSLCAGSGSVREKVTRIGNRQCSESRSLEKPPGWWQGFVGLIARQRQVPLQACTHRTKMLPVANRIHSCRTDQSLPCNCTTTNVLSPSTEPPHAASVSPR
jgi:hypothetical protein